MSLIFRDIETDSPIFRIRNAINVETQEALIAEFKDQTNKGTHQNAGKFVTTDNEIRNSGVVFFTNPDLHHTMWSHMNVANYHMGLRYKITAAEAFQFTRYDGNEKQHYNWHSDGQSDHYAARNFVFGEAENLSQTDQPDLVGTCRKISASLILNDDFEGGEFEVRYFEDTDVQVRTIPASAGDMLIFPSWMEHRIKPVTKGTRYSVVIWYAGPPLV
tara:strand:+ start:328 stop:978 length:651 start_codon:yes stop_codon:yes gene_type:complete